MNRDGRSQVGDKLNYKPKVFTDNEIERVELFLEDFAELANYLEDLVAKLESLLGEVIPDGEADTDLMSELAMLIGELNGRINRENIFSSMVSVIRNDGNLRSIYGTKNLSVLGELRDRIDLLTIDANTFCRERLVAKIPDIAYVGAAILKKSLLTKNGLVDCLKSFVKIIKSNSNIKIQ